MKKKKKLHKHHHKYDNRTVPIQNLSLKYYINRIKNNEYFSFTRWGDGEWKGLWRMDGRNGRSQSLSPAFREEMRQAIDQNSTTPNVFFGLQNNMLRGNYKHRVIKYLRNHNLKHIKWVNADIFHYANRSGEIAPLLQAMRQRKVVVVGPPFMAELKKKAFPKMEFIEIPQRQCFGERLLIMMSILDMQDKIGNDAIYSFSAGPTAEMLILNLQRVMPENFFIDFGSVWDIFCGRHTRHYTQPDRYSKAKLRRNLGI